MVRPLISGRKLLTLPMAFRLAICFWVARVLSTTLMPTGPDAVASAREGLAGARRSGSVASSAHAPRASMPATERTVKGCLIGCLHSGGRGGPPTGAAAPGCAGQMLEKLVCAARRSEETGT